MNKKPAFFNWSGGKDSCIALHKLLDDNEYDTRYLLTTVSNEFRRIIQHGVKELFLDKQAESVGIPLKKLYMPSNPDMNIYEELMNGMMMEFKDQGICTGIFGDIFLEDLRKYREEQFSKINMNVVFPLWKQPTDILLKDFIRSGFKAVIVCVNGNYLDKSFAGREIDDEFIKDLPPGVDPCGENGEYHSFVYDGPIFKTPVSFNCGEIIKKIYSPPKESKREKSNYQPVPETVFWYCDLN